jgi:hypothetical protein
MPEFILDHGSSEASRSFSGLDAFAQGYIEAMFFTSEGDENDLANIGVAELAPDTLAQIVADCYAFQMANAELLQTAYAMRSGFVGEYDESRAGNDYWYTRNGHGTGFWDRGLCDVGDKLADAARYSERNLYRGDDGMLYLD